ncbi:hypothetical protein PybrP1_011308 [[Pythium] brassicae (nom. inval.)]|nr:hypothetical protein PybrP1_011308 [[Pythium] brassicae (nom. inval.)]
MTKFSCERYFPATLQFSSTEREKYVRLAHDLVTEVLDEYAEYRTEPHDAHSSAPMSMSVVDPLEWKAVAREGDLTRPAYTQRLRRPGGDYVTIEAKNRIPTLLVVGTLRGRLNDTMYGAFADSDHSFRVRSSYLDVELEDSKLLYTFENASLEEPFRFCGLLWGVNVKHMGLRRRDNVLLMASGTTTSKQGDRIGYTVVHSVDIPELRPLTQYKIERAYGSLVFVKRQLDEQTVEMFQRGFFTAMGDIPEFAITTALIRGMVRAGSATIEASLSKKLFWMLQDAARLRLQNAKADDDNALAAATESECGGGCKARLSSRSSKGTCMICRKLVCSNCRVNRKITIEATAESVLQKTLSFCALCVTVARNTSALTIATREVLEREARDAVSSFRSTASSHSSLESPLTAESAVASRRQAHVQFKSES